MSAPLKVLISYSHHDEARRVQLLTMLAPLVREGLLSIWSDHKIPAGANIDHAVQEQLKVADLILLLVSPDFLNSDYCYSIEMEAAIERHLSDDAVVIPVILRPSDWARTPFSRLKAVPVDAKPIAAWVDADEAWLAVVTEIRSVAELVLDRRSRVPPRTTDGNVPLREALKGGFETLQRNYESDSTLEISFGIKDLDEPTDGIRKGELFVAAARPQSALLELGLTSVLYTAIKHKKRVLVASPRHSPERLSNKLVCSLSRVSAAGLQRGDLDDEDWSRINMGIKILSSIQVSFFESPNFSLDSIETYIRALDQAAKPDFLFLDGVDYLNADGRESAACRRLASLARRERIGVLVTVALGPSVDTRANRRPVFSDLSDWHAFHEEADGVMFLYRPSNYTGDRHYKELVEVDVAKNPRGSRVLTDVYFWDEYGSIDPVIRDPDHKSESE